MANAESESFRPTPAAATSVWAHERLSTVVACPIRSGTYVPKRLRGRGVKLVNMGELFGNHRLFDIEMERVPVSDADARRFGLNLGDLLFARRSMIGTGASQCSIICEIEHDSVFDSSLIRVRVDPSRLDPQFLFYFFWSPEGKAEVDSIGRHGPISGITGKDLGTLPVPVPDLREQRSIARVLGSLDDKIELNRRMNQTLEQIAQALFKSWFVDFDPVRAKAEGRWKKGESLPGMPADMWDLWPSEFEESEIGGVPKGWEVEPLSGTARFLNGLACQGFPPESDGVLPVLKIAELRRGNTVGADRASASIPAEYHVNDGDLIFSWSGSLEVKFWYGGSAALNQHLFKVTSHRFPLWLCYGWILGHLDDFRHIAEGKATTMGHIQRYHLDDALVVVPEERLIREADKVVGPLRAKVKANDIESRGLTRMRDALLPKLLSGEIRVPVDGGK